MTDGDRDAEQRVAVVTGGSQGIGAGVVAGYRQQGWAVVANSRSIKPSREPDLLTVAGDISERAAVHRIIDETLDHFGRIDTLVNNAGIFTSRAFIDYTDEDYAAAVAVNLTGFFRLTQLAVAAMLTRGHGHVVTVTTTLAETADSAVPSVLTALTKGRGRGGDEVARDRVRVARDPLQCRLAGRHSNSGAARRRLRQPRQAPSVRTGGRGQRCRQGGPLLGVLAVHDW